MASERFEMRVPKPLLDRLDEARGFESRASFVKRALESALVESRRALDPRRDRVAVALEAREASRGSSPSQTPAEISLPKIAPRRQR